MLLLVLVALPTLAQDVEETSTTYKGLGLGALIIGLGAAVFVGVLMSRREATGHEDDLV
jgi:hypothetical protein